MRFFTDGYTKFTTNNNSATSGSISLPNTIKRNQDSQASFLQLTEDDPKTRDRLVQRWIADQFDFVRRMSDDIDSDSTVTYSDEEQASTSRSTLTTTLKLNPQTGDARDMDMFYQGLADDEDLYYDGDDFLFYQPDRKPVCQTHPYRDGKPRVKLDCHCAGGSLGRGKRGRGRDGTLKVLLEELSDWETKESENYDKEITRPPTRLAKPKALDSRFRDLSPAPSSVFTDADMTSPASPIPTTPTSQSFSPSPSPSSLRPSIRTQSSMTLVPNEFDDEFLPPSPSRSMSSSSPRPSMSASLLSSPPSPLYAASFSPSSSSATSLLTPSSYSVSPLLSSPRRPSPPPLPPLPLRMYAPTRTHTHARTHSRSGVGLSLGGQQRPQQRPLPIYVTRPIHVFDDSESTPTSPVTRMSTSTANSSYNADVPSKPTVYPIITAGNMNALASRWSLVTSVVDDHGQLPNGPSSPTTPDPTQSNSSSSKKNPGLRTHKSLNFGINVNIDLDLKKFFSSSGNNNGSGSWGRSASVKGKKKKLVIKGVPVGSEGSERYSEKLKEWCESFGQIRSFNREPNGDILVDFVKSTVADRVCCLGTNAQVAIRGVGSVTLSYYTGKISSTSSKNKSKSKNLSTSTTASGPTVSMMAHASSVSVASLVPTIKKKSSSTSTKGFFKRSVDTRS